MTTSSSFVLAMGAIATAFVALTPLAAQDQALLRLSAARVSIAGTANTYPFTASSTDVRLSRIALAPVEGERLQSAARPGGLDAFEIAIPAASLTSTTEGLDKNMHKALKSAEHPDITFKLIRLEAGAAPTTLQAVGLLKIAGVEKEVALNLRVAVNASTITVFGDVALVMTDYGITPPTAVLGMLKTDPKITVTFETVLAVPPVTTF